MPGATYTVGVHGTTAIEQAETIAFTISLATESVDAPLTLGVVDGVSVLVFTVTFYANLAHSLTRSP